MIKAIVAFVGIIITVAFLITGLFGNRNIALRRAGIVFFPTVLIIITLTIIESNILQERTVDKEVIFVAAREAPLGGIALTLYADSSFELGNSRNYQSKGRFKVKGDTIFISSHKSSKLLNNKNRTSFLIKNRILEDIGNSGIVFLEIKENNLK